MHHNRGRGPRDGDVQPAVDVPARRGEAKRSTKVARSSPALVGATLLAIECMGPDQLDQRGPWHHSFHLRQKFALAGSLGRQVQAQIGLLNVSMLAAASCPCKKAGPGVMQTIPRRECQSVVGTY